MKKILLVEDDWGLVKLYKEILGDEGFEVKSVIFGRDALEKLKKDSPPDLILLDLILPDINGIEVLEAVRTNDEIKHLPVIVLTNYSDKALKRTSLKMGAKYFVKTDLTPLQMIGIIKKELKGKNNKN